MAALDFWFDYSCPFAYLASTQVEGLAARTSSELRWRPMLLGGVFRAIDTPQNLSEVLSPPKARHNLEDMQRWAQVFGVTLTMPSGHPMRTVEALRATLAVGIDPRVVHGFYRAYWIESRAPSDPKTIRDVLGAAGHDADAVLARLGDYKDDLRRRTEEAIALGIFGAPAFVVNGAMYWGQDRMHFVERALGGRTAPFGETKKTMPHELELYWDFSSPFSYLASTQAEALARRTGATLTWRPMLLGAVFKAIGQADAPVLTWPQVKRDYTFKDMVRWAEHWGVPFKWPSRFPMSTVKALRAWLALPEERRAGFLERTYRAYWAEDRDIGDDATMRELIGEGADDVLARCASKEVKDALFASTQRAIEAGVFGAPTWVVDGKELYWGQDRIELVERALTR
jgi:2-hydroxychromene-2-carboxylate isomerase